MKTKKTLSVILAVMMILSALPIVSLAAETPTIISWPTVAETYMEVGMKRGDVTLVGGEASVPGTFTITGSTVTYASPSEAAKVAIRFLPDDTEAYTTVSMPSAERPSVEVRPCSTPVLQGEITAKTILTGAALSTSELALAADAVVLAREYKLTTRVDTITFDNPDKVYTEEGTYEEPVTIKFKVHSSGKPYAVDLKATAKIKIADKLDAEIITAPTIAAIPATDTSTAKDLTVEGGEANVEGTFAVTNPDQKIVPGENIVNVTFTPADTSKWNPVTVDVTINCKGRAPLPEKIVIPFTFNHSFKFKNVSCNGDAAGINIEGAKLSLRSGNNSDEFLNTRPMPGEYEATALLYFTSGTEAAEMYEQEIVNVIVKVTPEKQTSSKHALGVNSSVQDDGSYLIEASSSCYYPEYMQGNVIIRVNGEVIGEEKIETSRKNTKFQYVVKKTGDYVVTAEYVPTANDCYLFEDTSLLTVSKTVSFTVVMPRTIKEKNCEVRNAPINDDGGFEVGSTISIDGEPFDKAKYQFKEWKFYDDEGKEFVPENLTMTTTGKSVTFTMPNFDMTAEYIYERIPEEEKPEEPGTDEPGFELPDIDIELPEINYDDMSQGEHNIPTVNFFKNLVKMIKDFIQQIGEFFSSLSIEDIGGALEGIVG